MPFGGTLIPELEEGLLMIRLVSVLAVAVTSGLGAAVPAHSASFDCAAASTAFERAICDNPNLSAADDRLALTYQIATGGLSDVAREQVRTGQREWLSYAQRACTRDARPLMSGTYDERGVSCLIELFASRSSLLEQSRMINGLRFFPLARYEALVDPNEADDPDSWWPLARHELSWVELDLDEGFAYAFSDTVREEALMMSPVLSGGIGPDAEDDGSTSDTSNGLVVDEVAGRSRISLKSSTYWYGHGAAHGNWGVFHHHYLIEQGRFLEARDIFSGDGWEKALLDLAVEAAEHEHGDNLMLDDTSYIADAVADPARWDLSDPYALVIQFQPYEIAAYAYGAPEARVRWSDLEPYLAETADTVRYGY
ncbi:MAG: hypothetical protein ABS75_31315 [Pelagibacterium sp. SCN 63-23]|nr:MAG: hypothetical protein ABS75_31315 [Pelagibacterium sp. SCN 63-23]